MISTRFSRLPTGLSTLLHRIYRPRQPLTFHPGAMLRFGESCIHTHTHTHTHIHTRTACSLCLFINSLSINISRSPMATTSTQVPHVWRHNRFTFTPCPHLKWAVCDALECHWATTWVDQRVVVASNYSSRCGGGRGSVASDVWWKFHGRYRDRQHCCC